MQGLTEWVPTDQKVRFINSLLKVGFDIVEVGSFVSPRAIPQMIDSEDVLSKLDLSNTRSKIMVLVVNEKGGKIAAKYDQIDYLSFPFSGSATFLKRNLNATFDSASSSILRLLEICHKTGKELIVYLSMSFGNPYGDPWEPEMVLDWAVHLYNLGVRIIPLSDILGTVTPEKIKSVYNLVIPALPEVDFGFHLHCKAGDHADKLDAAFDCGVRRFDTVLSGIGGCPMADDLLVGNLNTMDLLSYLEQKKIRHNIDYKNLLKAQELLPNITNLKFQIPKTQTPNKSH